MLEMRKRLKQSEDEHMLSNVERSESRNEIENQLRHDLKIAKMKCLRHREDWLRVRLTWRVMCFHRERI